MLNRLLLLLGGTDSNILDTVAEAFVPAAGARGAIALLMMGGPGWERYLPQYVDPWERRGAVNHSVIVPRDDGLLDFDAAIGQLRESTGIFIAGGHTPTYHRLYAAEPMRSVIRERYHDGVPVAGLSAGALIAPDLCVMDSEDSRDKALSIVQGLGLVGDLIVGVHFSERRALPTVLEAMSRTQTRHGIGIDSSACAVLENGRLTRALGGGVHQVTMTDFESKSYNLAQVA